VPIIDKPAAREKLLNQFRKAGLTATVVESLYNCAWCVAVAFFGRTQDAEDAVQSAMCNYLIYMPRCPIAKPLPFLRRIVRNECNNVLRDRKKRLHSTIIEETCPDNRPGSAAMTDNTDLTIATREAFEELTPEQQEFLKSRYFENLKFTRIAELLKTNTKTIYSRHKRALEILKATLKKKGVI
jgi:RNA polymerase sigma factor (sigma-70 family)